MRTQWSESERDEFVIWHESVLNQYPAEIQKELRLARLKFLQGVRITSTVTGEPTS